jgi:hypothetical protein
MCDFLLVSAGFSSEIIAYFLATLFIFLAGIGIKKTFDEEKIVKN